LPRVACPHLTSAATTSRPKPCPCALSLSQRPSSGETESASSNEAMPRHSLLSSRRTTKENLLGSSACTLFSHRVTYSLHDGGPHGMNLAMAGVMHPKTSCASVIWNWLSCNLGDWMTIIVSAYQRRIIRPEQPFASAKIGRVCAILQPAPMHASGPISLLNFFLTSASRKLTLSAELPLRRAVSFRSEVQHPQR